MGYDSRLAAAGPRQDKHRAVGGVGGLALRRVERVQKVFHRNQSFYLVRVSKKVSNNLQ
jgi:hypothetical protein